MRRVAALSSVLALALALPAGARDAPGPTVAEFDVPVLTVGGVDERGFCDNLPFRFERVAGSDAPLKILVSEDVPAGSSPALRASVWLAAVTAAIAREDALAGVRVTVEFSGWMDGPSAGSALCVAMLGALDGRPFPSDFAITGTILPDGTVGSVGGVAAKLAAAAAAGRKRVCIPAFLRFEETENGYVDLFRLGEKLGIEVKPVSTVEEAYAWAHKLPPPAPFDGDEAEVLRPDRDLETILQLERFALDREVLSRQEETPKEELDALFDGSGDPGNYFLGGSRWAYQSGWLFEAADQAATALSWWNARELVASMVDPVLGEFGAKSFEDLSDKDLAAVADRIAGLRGKMAGLWLRDPEKDAVFFFPDADWMGDVGAQLESDSNGYFTAFYEQVLENAAGGKDGAEEKDDGKKDAEESRDDLLDRARFERTLLLVLAYGRACEELRDSRRATRALALPRLSANAALVQVENLFHSAWIAADESLDSETFAVLAEANDMSRAGLLSSLESDDFMLRAYGDLSNDAEALRGSLSDDDAPVPDKARSYHAVVALLSDVRQLALVTGLLVKFDSSAVDFEVDEEEGVVPLNHDVLTRLLRTARERALRSIARCRALGIPCPAALDAFETAEVSRDDPGEDRIQDSLCNYWRAGLAAKALVMAFQKPDGSPWTAVEKGETEFERMLRQGGGRDAFEADATAALEGDAAARNRIGLRYGRGRGLPRDPAAALPWFRAAAEQGNAHAQFNYAALLESGDVGAQDGNEIREWMEKAAAQGHPKAGKWIRENGSGANEDGTP